MTDAAQVTAALAASGDEVDRMVAGLGPDGWATPTPAPGWTVAHQIAHLAATFRMAGLAAADPGAFGALAGTLSPDFDANVERALSQFVNDPPEVLLARWRQERATAGKALDALPPDQLVPWLVRPIPAATLAAAGMMELFGHGQDIADALGIERTHTDRLRYLVTFAVRTWDFGYLARGLPVPEQPFRFEITAPSGALWEFGPAGAAARITGPAADFCLLVTRRRHHRDLTVRADGAPAEQWLEIAQAYRGPAGEGRRPGQFA
ncbi:wyosine base formation [Actinoplanes ianthinogenes]|uniref:Wyosine base formation n=1 Tax=Actinoplanes ianthinogenes TaxID=122358 RepID=A0ABM7LPN7_9ACTN|nr:TIGR03084 family metal-binding protein [Actinoplanes ianthinogenes]BCJ41164.1 wyosine base formation [Actinoplanes ianthinogenes]GGR22467.1 wyosine base formation [Actinoplanes ianthinogenes]